MYGGTQEPSTGWTFRSASSPPLSLKVPTVLPEGLYAIPALLGASVLVVAEEAGISSPASPVLAASVCVVIRLVGLRYGITLPTARRDRNS